jgi:hypothetical protein
LTRSHSKRSCGKKNRAAAKKPPWDFLCKKQVFFHARRYHLASKFTSITIMSAFEDTKAPAVFTPPAKIEEWYSSSSGGAFSSINAPTAGARFEQELPRGSASFQLYSLATPNGQKVGILLEELGIEYDAHGELAISPKN